MRYMHKVNVRWLCPQHLMREHNMMHFLNNRIADGTLNVREDEIETGDIGNRHDALVAEIERRTIAKHRSPFSARTLPHWEHFGHIDAEADLKAVMECGRCRALMEQDRPADPAIVQARETLVRIKQGLDAPTFDLKALFRLRADAEHLRVCIMSAIRGRVPHNTKGKVADMREVTLTLENGFHNTTVSLVAKIDEAGRGRLLERQVQRSKISLCGSSECECGDKLGVRGEVRSSLGKIVSMTMRDDGGADFEIEVSK